MERKQFVNANRSKTASIKTNRQVLIENNCRILFLISQGIPKQSIKFLPETIFPLVVFWGFQVGSRKMAAALLPAAIQQDTARSGAIEFAEKNTLPPAQPQLSIGNSQHKGYPHEG